MNTVDLFEAWSRWAEGDPTLRDASLWGARVFWWGRIGKLAAFLSGLILIIDLVGPDRIAAAASRYAKKTPAGSFKVLFRSLALLWLGVILMSYVSIVVLVDDDWRSYGFFAIIAGAGFAALALSYLTSLIPGLFEWLGNHGRLMMVVRTASLTMFMLGFHFDMLAS